MILQFAPICQSDTGLAVVSECRTLPDLPAGLKFGAGARMGRRLYVGLGSLGRRWLVLDLDATAPAWRELPEFPGVERDQAVAVGVDDAIHVYGGLGSPLKGEPSQVLDDAYKFDVVSESWVQHPGRIPGGQLGAAAVAASGGRVLFFGGVHKPLFDSFVAQQAAAQSDAQRTQLSEQYLSKPASDYRFASAIRCHLPGANCWSVLDGAMDPPVVGAAIALSGDDVTLIGGEIKPGVRTPLVQIGQVRPNIVQWKSPVSLPPAADGSPHEGVAGAMCGHAGGVLLCAGGTNFPGAAARLVAGQSYAHRGLAKSWRSEVLAWIDNEWRVVGRLGEGRAHGLVFEFDDQLWLVGGEAEGGVAHADTVSVAWLGAGAPGESLGQ